MEHRPTAAEAVAARVEEQIETSGVTVVWLCEKTGIPRSTMVRRLAGHTAFNMNELERIAEALRVSVADLLAPLTETKAVSA